MQNCGRPTGGFLNADFVALLGKDAKKVPDAANRANSLWGIRLRCRKRCLAPLVIPVHQKRFQVNGLNSTTDRQFTI